MPLVELRKCAECGKTAWHELVDRGPPAPCYWRCRACGDRRSAKRVAFCAEDALHRGHVQTQHQAAEVYIVDISVHGARLRFVEDDGFPVAEKDQILFNAGLRPVGPLAEFHMAAVRWVDGGDFGIAFNNPLSASPSDLSCVLKG